jgi:hypothetical protein
MGDGNRVELPVLPTGLKLADLELEPRTVHILRKSGYARNTQGLSSVSLPKLMALKGFGTRCLVDLLTSIEGHIGATGPKTGTPAPAMPNPSVIRLVRRIAKNEDIGSITRNDLRCGEYVRSLAPGVKTLGDALQRARVESSFRHGDGSSSDTLRSLERALRSARTLTLEEELAAIGAGLNDRDREIIFRKLGFDGAGGCTLEEAGASSGVTRERVRQLIQKLSRHVQGRGHLYLPALDRALSLIASLAPSPAESIEAALKAEGVVAGHFRVEGVLEAAALFGREATFSVEELDSVRLVVGMGQEEVGKIILSIGRRLTEHWGLGRIADVASTATERTGHPVPNDVVTAVLLVQADFEWLDESGGWFWLTTVTRNRVVNQIRKMLSAYPTIPMAELRHGVSRPHRMQGFAPPSRVLVEICRRLPECVAEDGVVRRSDVLEEDEDLSPTEIVFARGLRALGGIGHRVDIEEICLGAGVSRPMIWRVLSYAAWIAKYAVGVYGFRGLDVKPEVVASLIRKSERSRTDRDYGWTRDGGIWLALELSKSVVDTGVFSVPAGMRPHLIGDFDMTDDSGVAIGRVRITDGGCWGLSPLFSRRGGEPGDVLLLVFDLARKLVTARLGGRDLLDQAGGDDRTATEE